MQKSQKVQKFTGTYKYFGGSDIPYTLTFVDEFEQASTGHTKSSYSGYGDGGSGWYMERTQHTVSPAQSSNFWITGPVTWPGPIGVIPPPDQFPLSASDIRGQGTKAIGLCAPSNPSFSLAQFLGEMREGAPSILGSGLLKERTRVLKGSGNEYLNVEFGWKPLVNDVKKFARAVKNSDKIIDNYRKHSNTKLRRRFAFDPVSTNYSYDGGGPCQPTGAIVPYSAQGTVSQTAVSKSWFSGAFKYYVPVGGSAIDKLKQHASNADKLLGVSITPELMWNLAPWTWAADWFANTGDILHNISVLGKDGLAMQYGYMMNSVENYTVLSFTLDGVNSSGFVAREHTFKTRVAANPFGFDLTFDGLSDRQKAIAAAIGVTRK